MCEPGGSPTLWRGSWQAPPPGRRERAGPLPMWGGLGLLTRCVEKRGLGILARLPRLPASSPEWGACGPARRVTRDVASSTSSPSDGGAVLARAVRVVGAGAETQARVPEPSREHDPQVPAGRGGGAAKPQLCTFSSGGKGSGGGGERRTGLQRLSSGKVHAPHVTIVSPVPAGNPGPQPGPARQVSASSVLLSALQPLPPPHPTPRRPGGFWRGGRFSSMYDFLFVEVKFT